MLSHSVFQGANMKQTFQRHALFLFAYGDPDKFGFERSSKQWRRYRHDARTDERNRCSDVRNRCLDVMKHAPN